MAIHVYVNVYVLASWYCIQYCHINTTYVAVAVVVVAVEVVVMVVVVAAVSVCARLTQHRSGSRNDRRRT
jgi:hypothetical protein